MVSLLSLVYCLLLVNDGVGFVQIVSVIVTPSRR